ncbi:hypothetical protein [Clostridium sp. JS66]|uniref:hypothetical protein n=1 Tax=Clostridium sp. JS66 TaxID=3064705 RepID=UPI00298EA39D|nr:hypothetical protein [Clostridium sp. JS66]WPC43872.1 hypothetical protein Q6H37_10455 [Clostridium sp. JS66]
MNTALFNFEFWSVFSCFFKSQELLMGSALVKLKDGSTEMLVSAAGKKGYVSSLSSSCKGNGIIDRVATLLKKINRRNLSSG